MKIAITFHVINFSGNDSIYNTTVPDLTCSNLIFLMGASSVKTKFSQKTATYFRLHMAVLKLGNLKLHNTTFALKEKLFVNKIFVVHIHTGYKRLK